MKTLHYAISIQASPDVVWKTMFAQDTYKLWTADFSEGSYFEGSWNRGERIRFLGPGGNGMTAVIAENRPHEFMSIKHLGYIKDGVEDTDSEEVRSWAPAFENYTFSKTGAGTELKIDIDMADAWEDFMNNAWPKALAKLKSICESGAAGPA
jgi:uncharacterized protein YndB with AHSA1/START domain